MKSTLSILVSASALAVLTACGGDGGGAAASDNKVAITATNQAGVVRASLNGGVALALAQTTLGNDPTSSTLAVNALMKRVLDTTIGRRQGILAAGAHVAAVSTSTDTCAVSGSLTTAFDDRDGNGVLSSGDVVTATFAQCKYASTYSVDGVVTIALTSTPTESDIAANATFQHVAIVNNNVTSTIGGAVAVHEADAATTSTVTLVAASGGFNVAIASSSYADSIDFESGFRIVNTQIGSGAQVTMDGSLSATSIDGRVTIVTQSPLTTGPSDFYPSSGVVKVTGANGSAVLATALSNTQVQLQVDANGDGSYEGSTTVAWSSLIPS